MSNVTALLQQPVAVAVGVIAFTWLLMVWADHRDADRIPHADGVSVSREQGAAVVGLLALWLLLRHRRRVAGQPEEHVVEVHRDSD